MFKLSHYYVAVNLEVYVVLEMEKSFSPLTRDALHVSCNAFHSGFWQNGTPCDLVSIDLLITLSSHQNTSTVFPLKEHSRSTVWYFLFWHSQDRFCGKSAHNCKHDFKSVSCLLRNNPICQMHCLDRQGGIWIPPFLALISKFTSARFQRVAVYYPLPVWQRCLPAFYASLSIWGYDAVFGSVPMYNLSEANLCHTSPHVLFMANMFPVNDSKYTGGCEEWFGKLPHTCHHHPPPLTR